MKGHVTEQGKGNWYAVVDIRDPVTGKRKRKWHSLPACGGKREAQARCAKIVSEMRDGSYVEPSKLTLAQFLDQWLKTIKPNVAPRTHERYEQIASKNIGPLLGSIQLSKLTKFDVRGAYAKALENGRSDGQGGLSPRTVHHMHRVLYSALNQAEGDGLIVRNPAALLKKKERPKIERRPVATIDAATTAKVFDAARDQRIFVPLMLAALTGVRRGEITALRWRAVDLDNGRLAVVASTEQLDTGPVREKESKSGKSRTVALPNLATEELRRWRAAQAEELLKLGVRWSDSLHVVTKSDGEPIQPRSLTHAMSKFLKAWGITLHGLRHSHASHMLAANVHPKIVQERLGHSGISITLDTYSHLLPNMQDEAARAVDGALRGAIKKPCDDLG